MLNRAPYNTEVPQFLPSRDAPINSYITRKYPCQERLAGEINKFDTLTWKIQQPDSSMVWQSVKVVIPMSFKVYKQNGDDVSMNVRRRLPTSNIALASSPMNAFRQTSLSLNGRIFSEENYYRDVLDACYRGVGTQAYGDNHSLKPIVNRNMIASNDDMFRRIEVNAGSVAEPDWEYAEDAHGNALVVYLNDIEHETMDTAFTLLEHNGPFIERARIFQDKLDFDGKTWSGEISHLLELGPFQARARKGNTAVPYIQDFHLRLNFANNQSKFDALNPDTGPKNADLAEATRGRTMAPKLLEFATVPNYLHKGEKALNMNSWPGGFEFTYTAQPYLEVVYTKHESPMRDSYNLRCFEHLYEKSNRFQLVPTPGSMVSPSSLQRVTSRLLSLPTKIYVWGEVSDEYKYPFAMGGVRRSCLLENLHLRVNQRPDVMFNPSQEECYEMFRRHTNSALEYGSWLKSPIYCFDMVDVGQPDMYSNDARVAWFEWDAEVKLTPLQQTETFNLSQDPCLIAHAYDRSETEAANFKVLQGFSSPATQLDCELDYTVMHEVSDDQTALHLTLSHKRGGDLNNRQVSWADGLKLKHKTLRFEESVRDTICHGQFTIDSVNGRNMEIDGCIWAQYTTHDGSAQSGVLKGDVGTFFYVPESWRFAPTDPQLNFYNSVSQLTYDTTQNKAFFTHRAISPTMIRGTFFGNATQGVDGRGFGIVGATNGCKTLTPGPYGYAVNGGGIANNVFLEHGNNFPSIDQSNNGITKVWVCFGPIASMPAFHGTDWLKWTTAVSRTQLDNIGNGNGAPSEWIAQVVGAAPQWGLGIERLNVETGGTWAEDDFNGADTASDNPVGPEMVAVIPMAERAAVKSTEQDYQLKVLYEYGNCQYNFSRNAAPTRILPNLVPVGPSPGIPAPL